ncbi:hypothetical protein DV735_g5197, partial [Chaetothyriales sp. CBS 134920]
MGSVSPPKSSNPLIKLHSKDHEEILNVIDQLRSEGISKYVGLPQIIVCGDQSSGKSSVLEAISGLNFPRKENLCTRFATELILRRADNTNVTVSILPDDSRSSIEKEKLRSFKPPNLGLEHFADIIQSAGDFIGVGRDGQVFSKDVLRVEFQSPEQPHLTLVDLPGLYHAPDESQDEAGVAFVESLVLSYMHNPRSVILAVVSAKSDLPLQKVTALTRKVDRNGTRTLGIITKPDMLPKGSDMEDSFFQLAMNNRELLRLGLGWHVLKNRGYEERDMTLEERGISEREFLSKGVWAELPRYQAGIDSLRPRLSTVLRDHILSSLPGLISEAQGRLRDSQESLQRLGQARQTLTEQRQYLFRSSERFTLLLSSAVNGVYYDRYFGDAMSPEGYEKRLRAVVQNRLSDFAETMRRRGESRKIVDDKVTNDTEHKIRRSSYVREVQQRMRRSRGCELPGTFSPLIIGELFYAHSKPWEEIANSWIELLVADVRKVVTLILKDTVDEKSFDGLLHHTINPKFDELEESLRSKTAELLQPQQKGHPITYNRVFTDIVQAARKAHLQKAIEQKLSDYFNVSVDEPGEVSRKVNILRLASTLTAETQTEMEIFACSEATDCMLAYYKIARRKFVDDFSNLAVEKCLLEPVSTIFSSGVVDALQDSIVEDIAAEDENSRIERRRLEEKIAVLQACLKQLHRLDRHHLADKSNIEEQHSSLALIELNDNPTSDRPEPAGEEPVTAKVLEEDVQIERPVPGDPPEIDFAFVPKTTKGKRHARKSFVAEKLEALESASNFNWEMSEQPETLCKTVLAGTIAKGLLAEVKQGLNELGAKPPHLHGILANDDHAARVYADWTAKTCKDNGFEYTLRTVAKDDVEEAIMAANQDDSIDGIIVYYPIFNNRQDQYLQQIVDVRKDSILPCTPLAVIKILEYLHIYNTILPYGNRLFGRTICVVNRSEVVGRPLAALLANDGATVYSVDVSGVQLFTRGAGIRKRKHEVVDKPGLTLDECVPLCDVVVTGVPSEGYKFPSRLLKEGANFGPEVKERASIYVPAIGKVTIVILLRNLLRIVQNNRSQKAVTTTPASQ